MLVEDDDLILLATAEELLAGALAEALDEDLEGLPHVTQVALERELGLQLDHLVEAADLLLLGDVVDEVLRSIRPGALGVLEEEGIVIDHLTHEAQRILEVLLALVVEAAEDIRRDGAVGHSTADSRDTLEVPLTGVVTLHELEDAVVARLCWQVDMLADIRVLRHHSDSLVVHILGVRRGEADTDLRHSEGNLLEEVTEVIRAVPVHKAVGIHILPEQRDLTIALGLEVLHLTDDALQLTATLAATGVGHDAVGAEVIAPTHDGDEAREVEPADLQREDILVGLGGGELYVDRLLPALDSADEIRQVEVAIGADDEVHVVLLDQLPLSTLRHTAEDADDDTAALLAADGVIVSDAVENFLLGIVAHRAGIEEDSIGQLRVFGQVKAVHLHDGCDDFAVGDIHLAAIGLYIDAAGGGGRRLSALGGLDLGHELYELLK